MVYDLIVIGGGPAGYLAAERAAGKGFSVLLAEKKSMGGVCLNEGCIPSKALLYSAKVFDGVRHGKAYGINVDEGAIKLDHRAVVARKDKVVKKLVGAIKSTVKKLGVEVVSEEAVIKGRKDGLFEISAPSGTYSGKRLLIATGSVPVLPRINGLDEGLKEGYVYTNREILSLEHVPETLAIVGGGIIGLEMASYFNSAGSRVTIIEMLDHIAGNTDREISGALMEIYKKKGVNFRLESRAAGIKKGSVICMQGDGAEIVTEASGVLMSIGRRPVISGIGLENVSVYTDRGRIVTDEFGRTNISGIYAAGDVNGTSMLAHTAYMEAEACVDHMAGIRNPVRYDSIPSVIYTNPEVASVGETSESAAAKGLDYAQISIPMSYSGRFAAENEAAGDCICKLIAEKGTGRLLGIHLMGSYSSEMIYGLSFMAGAGLRISDIRKMVFPHPTVSEIIREAAFMIRV
ncbi:MAG: dihydrolipoyl dehydrogenase [Eubacteriales bacterium]|nr:dihydrolipoyl dehydrogenase [Eubacteriales bacterium]